MVIGYLIHDVPSLRACSETCRSWYISAFPYLHFTLFVEAKSWDMKFQWPNPIRSMHKLDLLPLVKNVQIHGGYSTKAISTRRFSPCNLLYFSALTNVERLEIHQLDIPDFLPRIREHFGHFLPTVRSLSLDAPRGSSREIVFFIGTFQNLEDLSIRNSCTNIEPQGGENLVPPFIPPLQGRLTMWHVSRIPLVRDIIDVLGGTKFSYMDVFNVSTASHLLYACAKTLQGIRLYQMDPWGEQLRLDCVHRMTNNPAVRQFLDSNFSWTKSLQTIEVTATSVDSALAVNTLDDASSLLRHALSTLQSPLFSQVVVVFQECDFRGIQFRGSPKWPYLRQMSREQIAAEASWHRRRFELLREAVKTRSFKLVLCVDVWGPVAEYAMRALEEAVAAEKAEKGFDDFSSEPAVAYNPHRGLSAVAPQPPSTL